MGLLQDMTSEPVTQLALRQPVLAQGNENLRTVIERMRAQKLGCVIVVDNDQKPVGMFTESMLTQLLARGAAPLDDAVANHMAEHWPWVNQNDPVYDVEEAMQARNVRFICVVDDDGRVVGLTGQKGLMEYVADHFPEQVMVQRVGMAPYADREGA